MVDGWFRSGDLGTKDDDGYITIVDRTKDMILRNGYNVYPREVEEVLSRHPAVAQVAVFGIAHATHGQEVMAAVILAAGATADRRTSSSRTRPSTWRHTSSRAGSNWSNPSRPGRAARCSSAPWSPSIRQRPPRRCSEAAAPARPIWTSRMGAGYGEVAIKAAKITTESTFMTNLVQLDGVSRRFGDVVALDDVSLTIDSGRIVGLLGPNGAGKTTLLSIIQGLRRPTSGTVKLLGGNPSDYRTRAGLGSTPQETALPATLRVGEVIDYVGAHFENPVAKAELAEEFGLADLLRRQTGALSGGQKRRLSVALAFVGRPKLVLLDEPTTGLDVDGRRALWEAVRRQHQAGATVVLTSHYLEEIEALAERVIVIDRGRVLVDDDLTTVVGQVGLRMLRLSTPTPDAVTALRRGGGDPRRRATGRTPSSCATPTGPSSPW